MDKDDNKVASEGEQEMSVPVPKITKSTKNNRPSSPAQSLSESLQEMRLMSEGKLKKRTWDELKNQLKTLK